MFVSNTRIFEAMGSVPRQQILGAIEHGVKNPGKISRELGMPRSTVEKHIRILSEAGLVSKVPVLNEKDRISVSYEINPLAYQLREAASINEK